MLLGMLPFTIARRLTATGEFDLFFTGKRTSRTELCCAVVSSIELVSHPGVSQPGVSQPGVSQPGVSHPGVSQPGVSQPGVSQPGVSHPGVSQPGDLTLGKLMS